MVHVDVKRSHITDGKTHEYPGERLKPLFEVDYPMLETSEVKSTVIDTHHRFRSSCPCSNFIRITTNSLKGCLKELPHIPVYLLVNNFENQETQNNEF